ncbi:MAG: glycosyl hydrolase family 17 [Candidatus Marinimicrobia bacterium]|nr:glycosyl hydrolase family 17 [Candidatus Neomarinimicrobiota bacterium]MCF7921615.1 glycosyl hydrolase family 17 [Candidatus Neomarinimicrobiota bacterium]
MRIKLPVGIIALFLSAILIDCYQGSAQPEISQSVKSTVNFTTDIGVNNPPSLKETPFLKRPFTPYLGDQWIGNAISYGCYREGQAPGVQGPSEEEILEDLNILKEHWNFIRVYGSDDDSERVLKVIHQKALPFKVMLGIWLENETKNPERELKNLEQLNKAIELANRYEDIVAAVNVGNETQVYWSWHHMESAPLIKYIRTVRASIKQPVATADDYNFWNKPESREIADEIDFIVLHAYALANKQQLEHAIYWTDSVYQDIQNRHAGMTIVQGETGWATNYNPEKIGPGEQGTIMQGEVSIRAQEKFLIDINSWINENQISTFLFEAFDEPWKGGGEQSGPNEVEKNWGVFYVNRTPKASFEAYQKQINQSSN